MKKLKEIMLSRLHLDFLLNKEEKKGFSFVLNYGVYCTRCNAICTKGVVDYTLRLNRFNDIVVEGKCGVCGQPVNRVMEFGENILFFERAMDYRESLQN